ncbi:hypothetical protein Bca4012_013296 [Brassica carinata]
MNVAGYVVALCLSSVEESGVVSSGGCISMTLLVLMAGYLPSPIEWASVFRVDTRVSLFLTYLLSSFFYILC